MVHGGFTEKQARALAAGEEEICCMCHMSFNGHTVAASAEDYKKDKAYLCYSQCASKCAEYGANYWGCFHEDFMVRLGFLVNHHPILNSFTILHDDHPGDMC